MPKLPRTRRDIGNLQTLQSLLFPSSPVDLVFVAIDFEAPDYIINRFQQGCLDTQVGLAILDTRSLSATSKFTTFNFITREDAYFEKSAPFYHWGTAEKTPVTSMLSKINNCLRVYQDRSIVLVGHGVFTELRALKALGFDFQEHRVIAKLDTYLLAQDLQLGHFRLRNLLVELECRCNINFHNAGNDANYTLRALLLLAIKAIGAVESRETAERVRIFWWIAVEEVSSRKWQKCMRRKAAKIWTLEEQEEIRVKRREYRELYIVKDGLKEKRESEGVKYLDFGIHSFDFYWSQNFAI
ncbi:hypothetical protein LOCC1_G001340 [Lachnellula occidentalis]|uniref:Gfd2/YDR514C-like C-terminal domain-containing protein n=1 Tax=Lachnellula occidentalis TaxID=215460 RepID=A0A8H8UHQ9_9HELO|nr:hypothetical protein LOCC1_G001340 [Lachnellula occidentalis]